MNTVLTEKEKKILEMRGENKTLQEVATFFGVTRERIRQIESRAKMKLNMQELQANRY